MKKQKQHIAILGAGITGLVLAWHLKQKGIPFTVFESQDRTGGVIRTYREKGFVFETGPNSGVISNPETASLLESLRHHIVPEIAGDASKARWILKDGKWHPLPSGPFSAVATPLFSLKDKLKILGEPFYKAGKDPDESVADLVKRRLGQTFLDYAVDPFISGIYAGDPGYLVTRHALPKLYNLEQNYGSFIKGSIHLKKERKKDKQWEKVTKHIFSFHGGLQSLTDLLTALAGKDHFILKIKNPEVHKLAERSFMIRTSGREYHCTDVVSTIPAPSIKRTFPFLSSGDTDPIAKLRYAPVTQVSIGFRKWEGIPLQAFGGLIPVKENRDALGVLFISSIFHDRAPENGAVLSFFMGGIRRPELAGLNNSDTEKIVEREMKELLGLKRFVPDLLRITRHLMAIAQYGPDTDDRLEAIKNIENRNKGLVLAGSIRDGIGLADRIKQASLLAEKYHPIS